MSFSTTLAESIRRTVEIRREEMVALCGRLVAARSVNPPGDTRSAAAVVQQALGDAGIRSRLVRSVESMPCVVAELDSGRPGPHLVLNVHLDTMPPGDEAAWSVSPWQLTRRDGRLYGLGMGNMKGAVAAMVQTARLLHEHRGHWSGRVTFTAVSDEVVFGEHGAAHLLATVPDIAGDAMLCGEGPGFRRLSIAEKGVLWLRLAAQARGGHSSAVTRGSSASAIIAAAVLAIDRLNGEVVPLPPDLAIHEDSLDPSGSVLTANVGLVSAGTFIGQIATEAVAEIDFRLPPGTTADAVERRVRDILAASSDTADVIVGRIKAWDPNWTAMRSEIGAAWEQAHRLVTGRTSSPAIRLPASDASRWRRLSVPALCYGPQPTLSAGIDDYAEEDEVLRCAELYTLTALAFLQASEQLSPLLLDEFSLPEMTK
ncbi:M20/M25/M40 family metallo-hydrolase [Ruicaihuangia caeni]|uniref:M20/M25/M40 family metallo-hydrolase n=1 Tax=Ruicaihuangia caeni TaxID=3042517 RepID=UPI00338F6723